MNLIDHSKINVAYCVVYKETMEEGPIELLMYISQKIGEFFNSLLCILVLFRFI